MSQAPALSALNAVDDPAGGSLLGVVSKRTYSVRGGRCVVAEEQVALVQEPRLSGDGVVLLHDIDAVLSRRLTDVVVAGSVHAPAGKRQLEVRVRAGTLDRRLMAFGPRRCYRSAGGQLRFSQPDPIEAIDVGWPSAYGGVDQVAVRKYGDPVEAQCRAYGTPYDQRFGLYAYPRNRAGKGYLIDASDEALDLCRLPELEDPSMPLVPERLAIGRFDAWPAAPLPASLGWLGYNFFPRMAMLGIVPPFDASRFPPAGFPEVAAGVLNAKSIAAAMPLAERLDRAVAQQSALGMRASDLAAGAPVELSHLHPKHATWSFSLSEEVPELQLQLPDGARVRLEPCLRTLLLEPERDRVCAVWVGEHAVPAPVGPGKLAQTRYAVRWHA